MKEKSSVFLQLTRAVHVQINRNDIQEYPMLSCAFKIVTVTTIRLSTFRYLNVHSTTFYLLTLALASCPPRHYSISFKHDHSYF